MPFCNREPERFIRQPAKTTTPVEFNMRTESRLETSREFRDINRYR